MWFFSKNTITSQVCYIWSWRLSMFKISCYQIHNRNSTGKCSFLSLVYPSCTNSNAENGASRGWKSHCQRGYQQHGDHGRKIVLVGKMTSKWCTNLSTNIIYLTFFTKNLKQNQHNQEFRFNDCHNTSHTILNLQFHSHALGDMYLGSNNQL